MELNPLQGERKDATGTTGGEPNYQQKEQGSETQEGADGVPQEATDQNRGPQEGALGNGNGQGGCIDL